MSAKTMADYLSVVTPDYTTTTLSVKPHKVLSEVGNKNQEVHFADDGSEERISLDDSSIFYVTLQWNTITSSDAGTILDFYHDSNKGNGIARTFYWEHPKDGNTYVVRFDQEIGRNYFQPTYQEINSIRLRVLGKKV